MKFLFLILVISGVILAIFYQPSNNHLLFSCPAGQVKVNSLCEGNPISMNWQKALSYCDKKQTRLANRNELLYYFFNDLNKQNLKNNIYWSSTTNKENPHLAWYFVAGINRLYSNQKELDGLVVCVK